MRLIRFIKNLFKKTPEPIENKTPPVDREGPTVVLPKPPEPQGVNFLEWAAKSAYISSTFEGKGGDYANITGNFDDAGLTCGLLGMTWKWGNQIKIISKYIQIYGESKIIQLMPKTGHEYLKAFRAGESGGFSIVASWSGRSSRVAEPYKSELTAFWSSSEMIRLQNLTYETMMGTFAKRKCLEAQVYFGLNAPMFEHYCFFWDQAVLNGEGKDVAFKDAEAVTVEQVLSFMSSIGGYNKDSNKRNYALWKEQVKKSSNVELHLFKMAYLRAKKSRSEFMGTTLMRRGTLALGIGYVNGSLRKYDWA